MFHDGDLQSGIALAVQQSKAVLCFVHDDTESSMQWENILRDQTLSEAIAAAAVTLKLPAGSQEASFLTPICTISSTPAIVVIRNAQVEMNLQSAEVNIEQLRSTLESAFHTQPAEEPQPVQEAATTSRDSGPEYLDLQPQPGQMRLPNNAYDALRAHTQQLLEDGKSHTEVFQTQLSLLSNIPIFKDEVARLRDNESTKELSEYARSRLLRLPAMGLKIPGQTKPTPASSTATAPSDPSATTGAGERVYANQTRSIPSSSSTPAPQPQTNPQTSTTPTPPQTEASAKQKEQRAEYIRMQRDREQTARAERERIKAQIKADREERRRIDELRKQGQQSTLPETDSISSSTYARTSSRTSANINADVRIQVRTFDGSTLRTSFPASSSITTHLRPWVDGATNTNIPYNLKLILTPLPNRTIEAGEEDTSLADLGVVGSGTFVMVPVKGYVESYSGGSAGLMGQNGVLGGVGGIVNGGYNLVSGTAGWALGGVKSLLGYGGEQSANTTGGGGGGGGGNTLSGGGDGPAEAARNPVRIRTLADQRAEERKKDHQFYNGNQLNFEPKKDDDGKKD